MLPMKRLKYILSSKKYLYISILIISLLYSLTSNFLIEKKSIYQGSENEIIGTIEKIKIDGDKLSLEVNAKERKITLRLQIDTDICPVLNYFQIFMDRTTMSKYAAKFLNIWFELIINDTKLL